MEKKLLDINSKEEKIMKVAMVLNALGNPIRLKILLYLNSKGQASWSEIEKILEKEVGRQNPNTINFHLNRLLNDGIIKREEGNHYSLNLANQSIDIIKYVLNQVS